MKLRTKQRETVNIVVDPDTRTAAVIDQKDPLSKSVVLGAQLLEENKRLTEDIADLEEALDGQRLRVGTLVSDKWKLESELSYWKQYGRQSPLRWYMSVSFELTPWGWAWKPQFCRSRGNFQFRCLFLTVDLSEA